MPIQTNYLFAVGLDVDPAHESLFNEVYEQEHVPALQKVPGVVSVARFKKGNLVLAIDGQNRNIVVEDEPKYLAIYEIESPEVLTTEAWASAIDRGRWRDQVRPHTTNRRLLLRELITPEK